MQTLFVAGNRGFLMCSRNSHGWRPEAHSLDGHDVTSLVTREGVILAGTGDGVFRSDDQGRTWSESSADLSIRHVRWMAFHPDVSDREFAGTEPAGIFVSHDGAGRWRGCQEVSALRDRFHWFLPYSPEAGCVRGFGFHGNRVYAAVEVGGVLRSDDAGETWRLAGGSTGEPDFAIPPAGQVHADVHSIEPHPSSADLVFAVTAEGLYRSNDGGDNWTVSHGGSYCRAAWIDPADADHVLLGPADTVAANKKNGRIEETRDGGKTWTRVSEGLDLPWPDTMVERFAEIGNELFAVTNDGRVYCSPLGDWRWKRILAEVKGVNAVAG